MPVKIFKEISSVFLRLLGYATLFFNLLLFLSYFTYLIPPDESIIFSLLGLVYPILLIVNVILFISWLFISLKIFSKKIFLMTSAIVLIAGFYHHSRFIQLTLFPSIPNKEDVQFNIMSFNVLNFGKGDNQIRKDIITQIKKENPDIICFQEYYTYEKQQQGFTASIKKDLGMEFYENFSTKLNNGQSFGLAIYSKFPIINRDNIKFNNDHSNQCIYTDILLKKDTFRIYNAHLGSIRFNHSEYEIFGSKAHPIYPHQKKPPKKMLQRLSNGYDKRISQINRLIPIINKSPYESVICTDLNDIPISYAYHCFDKYYTDAFTLSGNGMGGTYIGNIPGLRIDYIWHSKKLKSTNYTTHPEEFSDHKAISATIYKEN